MPPSVSSIENKRLKAILYNDRSILENHHVSAAFKMLQDNKGSNIVSELTRDQFEVKNTVKISVILVISTLNTTFRYESYGMKAIFLGI